MGHIESLDETGRGIVERCVRDRQAAETRHHCLILKDCLEDTLGHFGLVRRIGGHELGAIREHLHYGRHFMVVRSPAREAGQRSSLGHIGRSEFGELRRDVGLAHSGWKVQAFRQAYRRGNVREQVVEGIQP